MKTGPKPRRQPVANTGIVFSLIFVAGYLLVSIAQLFRGDPWRFINPSNLLQLLLAGIFFLSSRSPRLYWIQPVLFLAAMVASRMLQTRTGPTHDSFYSIGFYIIAMLLLFKIGFFNRHRRLRLGLMLLYLYLVQFVAGIIKGSDLLVMFTSIFFTLVFLVVLWVLYHDEIVVYLKEAKPVLDLTEKGLTNTEQRYLMDLIAGKNIKEIASDADVTESTVRNTLVKVYQHLNVQDKTGLMVLLEKHEVHPGPEYRQLEASLAGDGTAVPDGRSARG